MSAPRIAGRRRGFTLLETVLALVVGALILAATMSTLLVVESSATALGEHAESMNDLAATQQAVRKAMVMLHVASEGEVSAVLDVGVNSSELDAYFSSTFPEPIDELPPRFEMLASPVPRLELVLREPLFGRPPPPDGLLDSDSDGRLRQLAAIELLGHRGVFELRKPARAGARGRDLWWTPLPPRSLESGQTFDETTLPEPVRLCRDVAELNWTAFIDSTRVPRVRAVEQGQLPAFIELELRTADGGYGNWTFELGFARGPEAPSAATPDDPGGISTFADEVDLTAEDQSIEAAEDQIPPDFSSEGEP
ncbi:MAG: prepilin-type N-terminal cleavage/methylation domain-containing protein [Planctomycetota bacterium]